MGEEIINKVEEVVNEKVKKTIMKGTIKLVPALLPPLLIIMGILGMTLMVSVLAIQHTANEAEKVLRMDDIPTNIILDMLETSYILHMEERGEDFLEILAYGAAVVDGEWENYSSSGVKTAVRKAAEQQVSLDSLLADGQKEGYTFYTAMFEAIFPEYVGSYRVKTEEGESERSYGVKNFYPMAESFPYRHYDDYGDERSYQGESIHEGNDIMTREGTPIVAVEGGSIENLGWNEWGGYRIGIRSDDKKRYYYYAHMLVGHPYAEGLSKGDQVEAGDVIGFVGASGYSSIEGTTGLFESHLHIQIEVTYTLDGEEQTTWINPYGPLKFLENHRKAWLIKGEAKYDYTRDKNR